MVNETPTKSAEATGSDRRERPRDGASHAAALGGANLNPFGDLHTLQHLSARLARSLRHVFEPLLRHELRLWAEPLSVQRFADYRAERPEGLTGWMPLAMSPGNGQALLVIDGKFSLELLDLFFGGNGAAPHDMPTEFSPAAEAMFHRLGTMIAAPMASAWEPLAKLNFIPGRVEGDAAMIAGIDGDDPVVLTRFGIAKGSAQAGVHRHRLSGPGAQALRPVADRQGAWAPRPTRRGRTASPRR